MMHAGSRGRSLVLALVTVACLVASSGCVSRTRVSLSVLSARSGEGITAATATFVGVSGTTVLNADASATVSGRVEADRTMLTVEAAGYRKVSLSVSDLRDLPSTVALTPLYLGTGLVTSGGFPVAGATVTVWSVVTTTGSDGSFAVEGLAEGDYTGRVSKQGFADATFEMNVGKTARPAHVTLLEGKLLDLVSPTRLRACSMTASYRRTVKGEERAFDGRVARNGENLLVMTGDPLNPSSSLLLRGGSAYVLENGKYVAKGETAAAAARILWQTCEDLLMLPTTFSGRLFTIGKAENSEMLLGQPCELWNMSGSFVFEGETVTATVAVAVGTRDSLAGVPVRIGLSARSTAFFDFAYDAEVEIVSIDQAAVSALFPVP